MSDETTKTPKIFFKPAYSGGLLHMDPRNWPLPTVFDIDGLEERPQIVPIVRDHDQGKKVGQTEKISYEGGEINAEGRLIYLGIDPDAAKIAELNKRGAALQASVATGIISPEDVEEVAPGETAEANGRTFTGPIEIVRKWRLKEISVVTIGADDDGTTVIVGEAGRGKPESAYFYAPRATKGDAMSERYKRIFEKLGLRRVGKAADGDPEEILKEIEQAIDAAGEEKTATAKKGKAEDAPEDDERAKELAAFAADVLGVDVGDKELDDDARQILEAAYAAYAKAADGGDEEKKEGECADGDAATDEPEEEKTAFAKKGSASRSGAAAWTRTKFPADALGQFTRYAGAGGVSGRPGASRVAEAALMTCNGVSGEALERLGYSEAEINEATSARNRNLTLKGLLYRTGAAAPGMDDADSIGRELASAQFKARLRESDPRYRTAQAAGELSTVDIPGVLANVMYKSLLNGLQTVDDPTDRISRVVNARDFREQSFVNLLTSGEFADVKANGELENLKLSDATYTNQAKMRGFELRLGYEAIANDDMNALQEIPRIMGRKAALRKQKIFFEALTAAVGITSVTSNPTLTLTGLDKAFAAFRGLKDADNDPIGARPRFLIVPPALEQTGYNLTAAANIVAGSTGDNTGLTIVPQTGRYAARLEVITSEYLGSGGPFASAWGDKKYMLLADPADLPLMILSYYQNQKQPQLKTVYGDVDVEGLTFKCWWGFGVSVAETKAAVVSNPS